MDDFVLVKTHLIRIKNIDRIIHNSYEKYTVYFFVNDKEYFFEINQKQYDSIESILLNNQANKHNSNR